MLRTLDFGERFFHSGPFSHLDMEAEMAELRTMTRVTKLRQQIECRQEGAWISVRDVPDDRARNGTRKVTSYGRTTRSVTRSFTSDVDFDLLRDSHPEPEREAIVEFPEEHEKPSKPHSVEITEITDNDSKPSPEPDGSSHTKTSPTKKTSVVTLGQGNVVLIDPQDSNFKVTGLSKDSTDEDVTSQKPASDKYDKKVKKVGFSKTEVHFAPDSGKVNIVETDEKPPSSQVLRRKKKPRREGPPKTTLPKLYFGDTEKEKYHSVKTPAETDKLEPELTSPFSHNFPVIREPSPLLSTMITNQAQSRRQSDAGNTGNYAVPKKPSQPAAQIKIDGASKSRESSFEKRQSWVEESKTKLPYLGNVSPKLSKLISNDIQHEFQLKQMEILKKTWEPEQKKVSREPSLERETLSTEVRSAEDSIPIAVNVHVTTDRDANIASTKPVKVVTQVQVSLEEKDKVVPEPRTKRVVSEPVYVNNTASRGVTRMIKVTREEDTSKARSSSTKISTEDKDRRRARTPSKPAPVRKTPTPRLREPKREVAVVKPMKPCVRNTLTKSDREPCRRSQVRTEAPDPVPRVRTRESAESAAARAKKIKEPLRSFEKVSNGWVGHCIVPVKAAKASSRVSITTASTSSSTPAASSSKIQGVRRDKEVPGSKSVSSVKIEKEFHSRSSLSSQKQFSLSREHLRSAKLVKELSRPDVPRPKSVAVRPRIVDGPKKNLVSRRRLAFEEQQTGGGLPGQNVHVRRDSEQSDDSVVRADEEVRAYMFNSRNKVGGALNKPFRRPVSVSDIMDEMTASYSEICEQDNDSRASDLPFERPKRLELQAEGQTSRLEDRLSRLDGLVMKEGDMISFVADDLETKIKLSSPVAYVDPWAERPPEAESKLLEDLELEASILAASVDSLTENLAETLHGISALTVDSLEVYRDVVCKTCDSVDTNIKAMYQLMAKCEEVSKSMSSVYKLAAHIKNIKHLLDLLEASPS